MACVDSAIIRALVEHIGMDPGSVGSSPTFLNATWGINEIDEFTFTLPEGQSLEVGSAIKFTSKDNSMTIVLYCVNKTTSDGTTTYELRNSAALTDRMDIRLEDGVYITRIKSTNVNTPDNVTTGIYSITIDGVIRLLMEVIRRHQLKIPSSLRRNLVSI